jgi:hypothetical protein
MSKNLTVSLASVLLVLLAVEAFFRLTEEKNPEFRGRWEYRANHPEAYEGADFYSNRFLDESMRSVRVARRDSCYPVFYLSNIEGKFINVRDGRRVTTDQPAAASYRVYLLGGSILFGQEVPDRYTLASALQRELNKRFPEWYQVVNLGVPAFNAAQEYIILAKDLELRPGDVVIAYDGANDAIYPVYNRNIEGWTPGESHNLADPGSVRQADWVHRVLMPLLVPFADWSAYARFLLRRLERPRTPEHVTDETALDEQVDRRGPTILAI